MAINDAMFTGEASILAAFQTYKQPFFSVWQGKDLIFTHNEDDSGSAEELFLENLRALESQGNRNVYKVKFHPAKEKAYITDKTPVIGSFTFRAVQWVAGGLTPNGEVIQHPLNFQGQMAKLMEKIDAVESKLSAIEAEEIEFDDEPENSGIGQINQLSQTIDGIMKNPLIQGLLGKLMGISPVTQNNAMPGGMALAGIPGNDRLHNVIEALRAVDPDIEKDLERLAVIGQQDSKQFNMLLGMLRNMVKLNGE